MKTICISGIDSPLVREAGELLFAAGLAQAKPAQRDQHFDIDIWHRHVRENLGEMAEGLKVGGLWTQLASDVFHANLAVPLWGWAMPASPAILEFWRDFDPQLNFVLLSVQAPEFLAAADDAALDNVAASLAEWETVHRAMLQFYHRNKDRCLLLSARDCLAHPERMIALCREKWQSPALEISISGKETLGPLPLMLAHQACQRFGSSAELSAELDATIVPFGPLAVPGADAVAALREQKALAAERDVLAAEGHALRTAGDQAQRDVTMLRAEQHRLRQAATDEQAQSRRRLEASQAETGQLQRRLDELADGSQQVLAELYETQRACEGYLAAQLQEGAQRGMLEAMWQRLFDKQPGYCDFASLSAAVSNDAHATCQWRFGQLVLERQFHETLQVDTVLRDGVAGLVLHRPAQPALQLLPAGSKEEIVANVQALRALGASDWTLARRLPDLLDTILSASAPAGLDAAALRQGLRRFRQILEVLAQTLHFDAVQLAGELCTPDYEYIGLQFSNVIMGNRHWPVLSLRLAAVGLQAHGFGAHTRLEFPSADSKAPFDSWYPEVHEGGEQRLDLRFARPDAMDTQVWGRLAPPDQALITALLEQLPAVLPQLYGTLRNKRPAADWAGVAEGMLRTAARH